MCTQKDISLSNLFYKLQRIDERSRLFSNTMPYSDLAIHKKECIGHVQKRVGTRLREAIKKNKGIGGAGTLTDKFIKKVDFIP